MSVIDKALINQAKVTPLRRESDRTEPLAQQVISELERSLSNIPIADRARVAELKSAILEGRYKIDAKAIAEGMIKNEGLLGE